MFVFLVHCSQVGWRVVTELLDQGFGVGGGMSKEFGCKSVDDEWAQCLECRASGKGGVRLG